MTNAEHCKSASATNEQPSEPVIESAGKAHTSARDKHFVRDRVYFAG